ncbi:hypothetical protein SAMN02799630_03884 [Paenibacillus sp. UNCCL117]|uniref:hypothetical protein n=1 Tax=unclassified Paenibacillus TaxID=185978 RepID=UPI000888D15F|nr:MULTISPECIES: hypothetical protein [unclassified Paenibacillus]SDD56787.1 hypothetical protein SAMN04488602_11052 [Paenibacillus sp. cl123]SFW51313.1 hypothetical protein SAMN02799630_03884 [Paenibacillus sp. UNCCL117]
MSVIEPIQYQPFEDEASLIEQCKSWGLLSEKSTKLKLFLYKKNGTSHNCRIVGMVDPITAVIEFDDQRRHCIHPSYLKEMQASGFVQRLSSDAEGPAETAAQEPVEAAAEQAVPTEAAESENAAASPAPAAAAEPAPARGAEPVMASATESEASEPSAIPAEKPKGKAKQAKAPKLQLPEEKVRMTATVKAFVTVPNHFSDTDDEVVVYEQVAIAEPAVELGEAWSSHSATLKKLELEVGDQLTFEGKLVAKKLTKHPVPYKINNPAKIQKNSPSA